MAEARLAAYMAIAETAYNQGLEVVNDVTSWQTLKTTSNGYASRLSTPSGLPVFKFEGFIDKPVAAVKSYFSDHYESMSREFTPDMFDHQTTIQVFDATAKLIHEVTKSPVSIVSPRDVVYFDVTLTLDEGTYVIVDVSVEASEVPPVAGYVRVDLKYSLHIFEQVPGERVKTHLTHVALGDPKGAIPASFVNLSLGSRADFYDKVLQRMAEAIG